MFHDVLNRIHRIFFPTFENLPRWGLFTFNLPEMPRIKVAVHLLLPKLGQHVMDVYLTAILPRLFIEGRW